MSIIRLAIFNCIDKLNVNVYNRIMSKSQQIPIKVESPIKRRGRPEKKNQPILDEGEELFTIHDNVFHASILFYTFRVFDKAPTRTKFNPTIGYSIYEKVKGITPDLRNYYEDDSYLQPFQHLFQGNFSLHRFFINSLTFGPKCVIDQFHTLFQFILKEDPSLADTIEFVKKSQFRYLIFNCCVMQYLQAKTFEIRQKLNKVIEIEHVKLLQIILHTLNALKKGQKTNKFAYILETEEDLFQRGVNSKPKKKVKKDD